MEKMRLHEAIAYAAEAHKGQKLPGTDLEFISHPLEVGMILTDMLRWDENLIIAGILHDAVNEGGRDIEEIRNCFGNDVADLVSLNMHEESGEELYQKQKKTEEVRNMDVRGQVLVLAETVSNLRHILKMHAERGDEIWEDLKTSRTVMNYYCRTLQDELSNLRDNECTDYTYWEMVNLHKDIFVKYYVDEEKEIIWQDSDTELYLFDKETLKWYQIIDDMPSGLKQLSRLEAEELEDLWKYEAHPMENFDEITLSDDKSTDGSIRFFGVEFKDGCLRFMGSISGGNIKEMTGWDPYEYAYEFDEETSKRFLCHMGSNPIENIVRHFASPECETRLREYCRLFKLEYEFVN